MRYVLEAVIILSSGAFTVFCFFLLCFHCYYVIIAWCLPYTPEYMIHFLPPIFVSKSGCVLYNVMLLEFFKFKNAFKSREIDPKRAGASYTRVRLIHECYLYTSATYTQVRLIHECDLYTSATYTRVRLIHECDLYTGVYGHFIGLSCLF